MRELLAQGLALAAFCGLTVLYLRPDWEAFGTRIAPDLGDPVLNLVLLKWVGHEAGRGFSGFWDAPFFFPCRGVLAYSDHLLGPGLVARAFTALVPSWIAAYDALLLAAFALTGWSMGFALRCGGMSWPASLAGGVM